MKAIRLDPGEGLLKRNLPKRFDKIFALEIPNLVSKSTRGHVEPSWQTFQTGTVEKSNYVSLEFFLNNVIQ